MSKNFELLTQFDKNRHLFGEPNKTDEQTVLELPTKESGKKIEDRAATAVGHDLGTLAREEVTKLVQGLKLPMDEKGRRRAANRAAWFGRSDQPPIVDEILSA